MRGQESVLFNYWHNYISPRESSQLTWTCKTLCWVLKDCARPCLSGSRSIQFLWSDTATIQLRTNWIIHKLSSVIEISTLTRHIELKSGHSHPLGYILYSFSYSFFFLFDSTPVWLWKPIIIAVIDTESPLSSKFLLMAIFLQAPCGNLCFEVPIPLCHSSFLLDVYPLSRSIKL